MIGNKLVNRITNSCKTKKKHNSFLNNLWFYTVNLGVSLALAANTAFATPLNKIIKYDLLADSCLNQENALKTQIDLEEANYLTYLTTAEVNGKEFTRVIVDVNGDKEEVRNVGDGLIQKGLIGEYSLIEDEKKLNLQDILEGREYITKKTSEINSKLEDVLILYTENFQNNNPFTCLERVELFRDLIDSHWDINSYMKLVQDYRKGEIDNFDVLMYLGENYFTDIPDSLIDDVNNTNKEILWVNYHPWELDTEKLGFSVSDIHSHDFDKVSYKDYYFRLNPTDTSLVSVIDPEKTEVLAWLVDNETGKRIPGIVNANDNFLYVSYLPLSIPYLDEPIPFFNALHKTFGHHEKEAKVLFRLEDVHAGPPNLDLISINEFLNQKEIPYHMGVIPAYVNPKENINMSILDNPELMGILEKMLSGNGNLILHGFTHQYDGETGKDYEFWDEFKNKPIEGDSRELAQRRIINALDVLKEGGLITDIWETPHYMASDIDYKVFEEIFPIIYDGRSGINVPFAFKRNNTIFSPFDLGYVSSKDSIENLIKNAKRIYDCFEDPSVSFSYHPFLFEDQELGKEALDKIIDSLKDIGYEFHSIYDLIEEKIPFEEKIISAKNNFQKGIGLPAYSRDQYLSYHINEELSNLDELGCEWVQIQVIHYQDNVSSSSIFADKEGTASEESLEYIINKLHKNGFKVFLEPVVNIKKKEGGDWRGSIKPDDWDEWFQSYKDMILHYSKLAQKTEVEEFSVGAELNSSEKFEERWRDIISNVRENYEGITLYIANFDHYKEVPFWDALDFVSMNFYFPINPIDDPYEAWENVTDYHEPTINELVENWQKWVKEIEDFQSKVKKPILISEIGYASKTGCSAKPWSPHLGEYNTKEQEDGYVALYQVWKNKPYIAGVFPWMWPGDGGNEKDMPYSLKNKPAEKVIEKWYKVGGEE